jgi:predicted acyltransferase
MKSKRLLSLDAFRGYTVAAMIMVNFPGSWEHVFPPLHHSEWNGLTFTDLVAPFFMFIIGVSITLAYTSKIEDQTPKFPLVKKIILRALKILLVGLFLNAMPYFNFSEMRYTGTLPRIAFVFLFSAILFLFTNSRQQTIILIIILLSYWFIMCGIPLPGEGKVMLEPGKNIAAYIDSLYLPGKMRQGTWDPEGYLSTLTATASCIFGMLIGKLILKVETPNLKVNYIFAIGIVSSIIGYFWGLVFPINEGIWTSSFVLITAGFACMLLALFYFLADILGHSNWTKLGVVFGVNAITAYVLADILSLIFYNLPIGNSVNMQFVQYFSNLGMKPALASWMYALIFVGINYVPLYFLHKRKIYIKL